MDHLPAPADADELQIKVPYYGGAYDDGPFLTYLERQKTNVYRFLNKAGAVLQPHTVTTKEPWLEGESWLEVEFERLVDTLTLASHDGDPDKDEVLAKLAELSASREDKQPPPQASALLRGHTPPDQSAESDSTEKITVRDVLKNLDEDARSKQQQGEMFVAEDCISWYRRVVYLARTAFGAHSEPLSSEEKRLKLHLALRKCSEPMPAALVHIDEASERGHSIYVTLQNWLLFGMLQGTFSQAGVEFCTADFVESSENGAWLSTKQLPDYINAWKTKEAEHIEGREARGIQIMSHLQWASKVAAEFERVVPSRGIGDSALSLCILLVACTLQQQANHIYGRGFVLGFTSQHLRRRFLTSGWCPNQVTTIEASFMLPWQYYIYLTGRDRMGDQRKDLHHLCTVSNCGVNQVSLKNYRLRHVFNDNGVEFADNCPICHIADGYRETAPRAGFFDPDLGELKRIVEKGGIPLISIYNANIEQYDNDPKIVQYDPSHMEYVAISHVWADGLGNPYSNSIHLCQIMMLAKALTQLGAGGTSYNRLYFWLDTICVPLEPASARIKAIQSIIRVFSRAKYTLVMTNDLRRRDVPATKLESITRILTSNWTRRLWTYSEAMLSNRIAFKYAGEWVDFHSTLKELKEEAIQNPTWDFLGALEGVYDAISVPWRHSNTITDLVKDLPMLKTAPSMDAVTCLAKVRFLAKNVTKDALTTEHTRALAFMSLIKGTPWKATSVAFDELVCIAQHLNMDLTPFVKLAPNRAEAFKLLVQMQHSFPREIIFVDATHMEEPGFRWSPRSYISECVDQRDVEGLHITRELALLSTQGLIVEWPGIIFQVTQPMSLKDSIDSYYFTFPINVDSKDVDHAYKVEVQSRKETAPEKTEESWTNMALILNAPAGLPLYEQTVATAVLAVLLRRTSEVCYVHYVTRVAVDRVELGTLGGPMWSVDLQAAGNEILDCVEVLPRTQAWCLS